jgi:hypothetical protein
MKPDPIILRSADAFQKWSDEHRAQIWTMIEKLGKGEVTCKEARDILREEKKALNAVSKQVLGFKNGSRLSSATRIPGVDPSKNAKKQTSHGTADEHTEEANLGTGRLARLIPA